MTDERPASAESVRLPNERLDRITKPLARFLAIETATGAVLLFFTIAALVTSNSPWAHAFLQAWETQVGLEVDAWEFGRSLREWINDGLMTLFFFMVALELKRELVLGELRNPRMAALSISAAVGGMLVPASLYLMLQLGQPGQHGWGTVMATDTAFVIGCLAVLGRRIPQSLRIFMLSLAIVDDIGAILVVAIGYSSDIEWRALGLAGIGIAAVRAMALLGFRSFWVYALVGVLVWAAVDASGIHATVTGVVLGLMTPARRWISDDRLYAILRQVVAHPEGAEGSGDTKNRETLQLAEVAARESLSPAERLEMGLHPWVGYVIMPLFAFANAGVPLSMNQVSGSVAVAILIGFAIGKPVGVVSFAWLAVRSGLAALPPDLNWRSMIGGGLLAGVGFTMALFIANLAFSDDLIDSAKLGILLSSVFSAVVGIAFLIWASRGRTRHAPR